MSGATNPKTIEFFTLQGRYIIDPATTREALAEDALCLLTSGLGVLATLKLEDVVDFGLRPEGSAYWCAIYALRQARSLVERLHELDDLAELDATKSRAGSEGGQ